MRARYQQKLTRVRLLVTMGIIKFRAISDLTVDYPIWAFATRGAIGPTVAVWAHSISCTNRPIWAFATRGAIGPTVRRLGP